jgi:hypothetical protein
MTALIALLTVVLLFAVISLITAPLRGGRQARRSDPERDDLEEARAAKYREIRDAELDYRTGKLSREDYEAVDGSLRTEAVEILDQLEPSPDGNEEGAVREVRERDVGPSNPISNPQADDEALTDVKPKSQHET